MFNAADAFSAPEHQPFHLPGERGAVLLVHGFGGTPAEMRGIGERLNAAGWAVHAPLLPGFGADFAALSRTTHMEWIATVRDAHDALRREHRHTLLLGFSMGGAISISVAAATPPDGLILINPFTRLENWVWKLLPVVKTLFPSFKPFQVVKLDFESDETRRNIGQYMPDADLTDPAVQEAVLSFSLPTRALDELRAVGGKAWALAPRLRTPTLIVQSQRDKTVPPAITRQLAERIPGARLLEIDAEHNFVQYDAERLDEAVGAIQAFLDGLRTP